MKTDDRILYRMPEAAELLGISRAKAYELANRGLIPVIRLDSGSIRVPARALRELIEHKLAEQCDVGA